MIWGIVSVVVAVLSLVCCAFPVFGWWRAAFPLVGLAMAGIGWTMAQAKPRFSRGWPIAGAITNGIALAVIVSLLIVASIMASRRERQFMEDITRTTTERLEQQIKSGETDAATQPADR
ncbi:MAG: hypothetical protein AAF561_01795 [Planctomycetota bacterium]